MNIEYHMKEPHHVNPQVQSLVQDVIDSIHASSSLILDDDIKTIMPKFFQPLLKMDISDICDGIHELTSELLIEFPYLFESQLSLTEGLKSRDIYAVDLKTTNNLAFTRVFMHLTNAPAYKKITIANRKTISTAMTNAVKLNSPSQTHVKTVEKGPFFELHVQLMASCKRGDLEQVKTYIKNGADINYADGRALYLSAFHKKYDVLDYLISNNADIHLNYDAVFKLALVSNDYKVINAFIAEDVHFDLKSIYFSHTVTDSMKIYLEKLIGNIKFSYSLEKKLDNKDTTGTRLKI